MNTKLLPVNIRVFVFVAMLFLVSSIGFSQSPTPWSQNISPLPPPTGFVNDYAGVLDTETKLQLETKIKSFRDTSEKHVELSVAIVKTTGDRPIFDYSLAVYRGWGIGSKEGDNPGALLLVAIDDRKYFTQVSKDLEDELPDGVVGSLQRQYLVPEFKKANYSKGISDTIDAYILTIQNKGNGNSNVAATTPNGPGRERESSSGMSFSGLFCCAIIILVIILMIFSRSRGGPTKGNNGKWGGGGFGGGGGALPWIIGGILSSGGGSSSGSSSDWGGSSGGGSDWGGFGGGGDAGGGGAGGDW